MPSVNTKPARDNGTKTRVRHKGKSKRLRREDKKIRRYPARVQNAGKLARRVVRQRDSAQRIASESIVVVATARAGFVLVRHWLILLRLLRCWRPGHELRTLNLPALTSPHYTYNCVTELQYLAYRRLVQRRCASESPLFINQS